MKILIMAAGRGQRFKTGGFEIPKPLIRWKEKTLIEWSIEEFPQVRREDIIVVGIPEVCHYIKGSHPEIRTVCVQYTQEGPGMSALLAGGLINPDESVVLVDCDVVFAEGKAQRFANMIGALDDKHLGGLVYATLEDGVDSSPYCSVLIDYVGRMDYLESNINGLEEKTGTSQQIALGLYGFKKWNVFRKEVMSQFAYNNRSEIYLSGVLDSIRKNQLLKIVGMEIPFSNWTCLGTPKDFEEASK